MNCLVYNMSENIEKYISVFPRDKGGFQIIIIMEENTEGSLNN